MFTQTISSDVIPCQVRRSIRAQAPAIYAAQAAMGFLGLAAGCAKLAGAEVMVDAFGMLGLGSSFRLLAGAVEVLGGLCLLLPRAGILGALLLASVVVGTAGLTLGQVASRVLPAGSEIGAAGTHQAVSRERAFRIQPPVSTASRDGISI
jgi:hypothetical protein